MQHDSPDYNKATTRLLDHYHRVNTCGTFAVVIRHPTPLGPVHVQYKARCGSRFCSVCSDIKSTEWQHKIIGSFAHKKCVMITLTFADSSPDPFLEPAYYSRAWDNFLKRLRRRYPSLCFARMVEITKAGMPHFHILVDRYIPQKYISWAFEKCGGGKVAWCSFVDPGRSAKYITKYVTKSLDPDSRGPYFFFLSRMRSVSTSNGLFYTIPRRPGSSFISHGTAEECAKYLQEEARSYGLLVNKILIDDPRSPPFVWLPDPTLIEPLLEPRMSFPLTYAHIRAWQLDLSMLPLSTNHFVYTPPGFTPLESHHLSLGILPEELSLP